MMNLFRESGDVLLTGYTYKAKLISVAVIIMLLVLIVARASLSSSISLLLAPVIAMLWTLLSLYMLNKKNLLSFPLILVPISLFLKTLAWFLIVIDNWDYIIHGTAVWPFSDSIYYSIESLGSLLVVSALLILVSVEERKIFGHGLIADSTLILMAASLMVLYLFHDTLAEVIHGTTWQNVFVRMQLIPVAYLCLISGIALFFMKNKLENKSIYLLASIPFSIHLGLEAMSSIVPDFYQGNDDLFCFFSSFFYDMAALIIIVFLIYADSYVSSEKDNRSYFRVSPLVWISSFMLITIQIFTVMNHEYIRQEMKHDSFFALIVIFSGFAVIFRLMMLVYQAKKQQAWLEYEVNRDSLTGLLNRNGFFQQFAERHKAGETSNGLLCVLDIDSFKSINDAYGHQAGDIILLGVGKRCSIFKNIQLAGRLGGDEFILLLQEAPDLHDLLDQLYDFLSGQYDYNRGCDKKITASVSIGAVVIQGHHSFDDLYLMADRSLYLAKKRFSHYELATKQLYSNLYGERNLLKILQRDVFKDHIMTYFQPIVGTTSGKVVGHEILMRLKDEDTGHIFEPLHFIEKASNRGRLWVMTEALLMQLNSIFTHAKPSGFLSINIPPIFLELDHLKQALLATLTSSPIPTEHWLLEITENPDSDIRVLQQSIEQFSQLGYRFALDDFGIGSSSLSRLAQLPVDVVKLDISLLRAASQGRREFLDSIVAMSHRLELDVVVEGIETDEQFRIIRQLKVAMAQGFLLGRPSPCYTMHYHLPDAVLP